MLSNTLRQKFAYLKSIHILHPRYHPKIIGHILKNKQKGKCVCIYEILRLIIMKMTMEKKNRSHRYNINRPIYNCLIMMMVEQLSNIWSSIQDKVKQHLSLSWKKVLLIKEACSLKSGIELGKRVDWEVNLQFI